MSYYDFDEFYGEPSEFEERIQELKSSLMDSVKQEIKTDLEHYKGSYEKKEKELGELKLKNKSLELENNRLHNENEMIDIILSKITKDNVKEIISVLFKRTFDEDTHDCPIHWGLYVNYYNDRERVMKILKYAKIEVPYDTSIILPHEWDKKNIDRFFELMGSHTNCNGQTYGGNLRFWSYKSAQEPFNYSCYTEIPWQFGLRNPLLNSEEYALRIAKEMSKGGDGCKFHCIDSYQKLDDNVLEKLVNNLHLKENSVSRDIAQFLVRNIDHIKDDAVLDIVVKILAKMWKPYDEAARLPEKYQIHFAKILNETDKQIEFFKYSTLSKEVKAKILSEAL